MTSKPQEKSTQATSMGTLCPMCRAPLSDVGQVWDDRYGHPGLFEVEQCRGCGHRRLAITPGQINAQTLYSDWYPRRTFVLADWHPNRVQGGFLGWLRGERASAFTWIPSEVRILDIGTGWGESLGYHAARGCEVWGVDADENLRRVADAHGFSVRIGSFAAGMFPAGHFDWITMDQVIEHLNDPAASLSEAWRLLKPGGHLVATTPNGGSPLARLLGRRWVHVHAPYHEHLFSPGSLRQAACAAGFVIERQVSVTRGIWYHIQWLHLAGRRPSGQASPAWVRSQPWRLWEQIPRFIAAGMHRYLGVNHILARILDACGWGDNQVMVLRKPAG